MPEGICLFYKGFLIVNSLEDKYLSKVIQRCKMNKYFEGGHLHQNSMAEIAVELFTLNKYQRRSKEQQNVSLM